MLTLARWLCVIGLYLTANPHVIRSKRVLEVGAGCGVSGLIAARYAERVEMLSSPLST
jgi:predicted nicotinamide N-methyase